LSLPSETRNAVNRLNRLGSDIESLFSGRGTVVELMKLALICREHVLLLGPPGSGKSELVMRFARGIQAQSSFQYLLTRFTEPAELFGPIDIGQFKTGRFHIITEGMLPRAEIAFLDEVFQASSAILNTLLTLIHERTFHNGTESQPVPLISLFGASNELPDDSNLLAFSDRFVLRMQLEMIPDSALGDLIDKGWNLEMEHMRPQEATATAWVNPQMLARLNAQLSQISIEPIRTQYIEIIRRLRAEGVVLSERRIVKCLKLIRGAALLKGRSEAGPGDFWPLNHVWNTHDEVATLREVVQPLVDEAGGPALVTHRGIESLIDDFELLLSRKPDGESAWVAHLAALAQLRRELLLHHPSRADLRERIMSEIHAQLEVRDGGIAGR
jgi:MoxR-like ATPase